jgi:signal transduction histidine kinase/ActR/RegA family two-component response regulator
MKNQKLNLSILSTVIVTAILTAIYKASQIGNEITLKSVFQVFFYSPSIWIFSCLLFAVGIIIATFGWASMLMFSERWIYYTNLFIKSRIATFSSIAGLIAPTSALIYHDHHKVTLRLFIQYQISHPVVIGLTLAIPMFFYLGFIYEEIKKSKEIHRTKSLVVKSQSEELQKEIEDRNRRENELIEAKADALAGLKAKDQFLSNMSHEIRTPMNGIVGLTNILKNTDLTTEQKKYVEGIEYSSKNLLSLINQILDLSKINSGKLNLECLDFNINDVIQGVKNTFLGMAQEKGIVLRFVIDPSVPHWVAGDPVRLNQILLNLIGNAVKFTEEGGIDVHFKSISNDDGHRLQVNINDTGIGIEKDKLETIFKTFTQASPETTRLYGGSGLGLAISKDLIELYGGNITVDSEIGKGSSFYFEIQLNKTKEEHTKIIKKTEQEALLFDPKETSILVVEDGEINQVVVSTLLEKDGFKVDIANNGQEAIDKVFDKHYNVILMDIKMPIMGGHDATRFIRNATTPPLSRIPIIAMTASAMQTDIDKYMESGMNEYVLKPFKPSDLYKKLNRVLGQNEKSSIPYYERVN